MNRRYPWHLLRKPGDHFVWRTLKDERSLRSQAHKQGVAKGVVYAVKKTKLLDKTMLLVTFTHALL